MSAIAVASPAAAAGTETPDPTSVTGAQAWWSAGYTGKGVDVAVIDSGVSPVQGLDAPGKVVYGPDVSFTSQVSGLRNVDAYGHGTFMAGLIAGNDGAGYRGMAPDARIVSIKVGASDGEVDVTQVIAAVDWVVQHAHDNGLNIRVLNLSYGTNSLQDYTSDPLAYAVEQAWKQGIVVVAASGNSGFQRGVHAPGVADPAYDPYVIAVGGADGGSVADFSATSATGNGRGPDLVAPGAHLQGLRVPGSWIDVNHPEGRIGDRFFRGSGTSEAAAVTSGAAALVLQKLPGLSPDQVKGFLLSSTQKLKGAPSGSQGNGELALAPLLTATPPAAAQSFAAANGNGSVEAARGQDHVAANGVTLTGERDIFGRAWSASSWSASSWSASSWSASSWSGSSWSASSWSASSWSASSWSGSSWSNASWS